MESLAGKLITGIKELAKKSTTLYQKIVEQSLVTPSCGLGSQTVEGAKKVLELLKGVSQAVRESVK